MPQQDSRFGILIEAVNRARTALDEADRQMRKLQGTVDGTSASTLKMNRASTEMSRAMTAVRRDVESAAASMTRFGGTLTAIGGPAGATLLAVTAVGAGMLALARHAADAQEQLDILAERTGASIPTIGALKVAASNLGMSFESLVPGLDLFNRRVAEAASGNEQAQQTFEDLRVSIRDGRGDLKSYDQLLAEVAAALQQIEEPAERTRLAMEAFGRSGARFISVLSADMEENKRKAIELGIVWDETTDSGRRLAEAARDVDSGFDRIGRATEGLMKSLGGLAGVTLAPLIEEAAELAEQLARGARAAAEIRTKDGRGLGIPQAPGSPLGRFGAAWGVIRGGADMIAEWAGADFPTTANVGAMFGGQAIFNVPRGMPRMPGVTVRPGKPGKRVPDWWEAGQPGMLGPSSDEFFARQRPFWSLGPEGSPELWKEKVAPDAKVDDSLTAFEEFITSFEDYEQILRDAGLAQGDYNETAAAFVLTLQETEPAWQTAARAANMLRQGLEQTALSVIKGTESIEDAFGRMIADILAQLAAEKFAEIASGSIGTLFGAIFAQGGAVRAASGMGVQKSGVRGFDGIMTMTQPGERWLSVHRNDQFERMVDRIDSALSRGVGLGSAARQVVAQFNFQVTPQNDRAATRDWIRNVAGPEIVQYLVRLN